MAPAIIVNAVAGWGKTTLASQIPGAAILTIGIENGYEILRDQNLAPNIPCDHAESWSEIVAAVDRAGQTPELKTLVFDSMGTAEKLCQRFVCDRDHKGNWGDKGFLSYYQGYETTMREWQLLLERLEKLRRKGIAIMMTAHCRTYEFKNPSGPDYARYEMDSHKFVVGITTNWADAVLFGSYYVAQAEQKGKAIGGNRRVLYTGPAAAYVAKNRFGMPTSIDMPDDYSQMWATLAPHLGMDVSANG